MSNFKGGGFKKGKMFWNFFTCDTCNEKTRELQEREHPRQTCNHCVHEQTMKDLEIYLAKESNNE